MLNPYYIVVLSGKNADARQRRRPAVVEVRYGEEGMRIRNKIRDELVP